MDVKVSKAVINGEFVVTITTENISQSETDLFTKWGVPKVDVGGTFPLSVTIDATVHDATFTVPVGTQFIKNFKTTYRLPAIDANRELLAIQEAQADNYASTMESRLQDAIADLKALVDTFTEDSTNTY